MEAKKSDNRTLIAVAAILIIVIFGVAIWATNQISAKDTEQIKKLAEDYRMMEKVYAEEIRKIDEGVLPYQDPATLRTELSGMLNTIKTNRSLIEGDPKKASKQLDVLYEDKRRIENRMAQFYSQKDDFTSSEISRLKQEVDKLRTQLDEAIAANKKLSAQLAATIKKLKANEKAAQELAEMQGRLNNAIAQNEALSRELTAVKDDRDRLNGLLSTTSQKVEEIKQQKEEVKAALKKAFNFEATYEFRNRQVALDVNGKHTPGQIGNEITVSFTLGQGFFDENVPAADRVVYLTLLKDNKPYVVNKVPVRVDANNNAKYVIKLPSKIDKGDFVFKLTYQEQPIMADYKFKVSAWIG
jgi:predicted  nucleic acid-binding Zn-ribbon protein